MTEGRILFLDLETSSLDPDEGRILEIGAILVTSDLVERSRWEALLPPPPIDGWVDTIDMHRRSGLLGDLMRTCSLEGWTDSPQDYDAAAAAAERSLLEWLVLDHEVPARRLELAGYSIHFDRSWLRSHLPRFASWLSHRMIDVSSIRQLDRRWRPVEEEPSKGDARHRALADCEHALATLCRYRSELWRPQ